MFQHQKQFMYREGRKNWLKHSDFTELKKITGEFTHTV